MLQETNESIRANLEMTQRITSAIKQENTTLTAIGQQGQEDSRTLKVLSILATIYLPATLIAVCRFLNSKRQTLTSLDSL
jgi:Mg2+ and Co2+ transporter CorA